MTFRSLLIATTALCAALSVVLMVYPSLVYLLFGIEGHSSASFIARRAAVMFLGVAVLAFCAKDLTDRGAQRAISCGMIVMLVGLALLGCVELLRGFAGPGILSAVITELAFAAAFLHIYRKPADA